MSGTVFLLFLLFGTPDSVSPLRSDKGRPEAGPERRRRRPDPADYRCHRLGYAAIVSPFFLYVDSVLLVSIAWADKDNIMVGHFMTHVKKKTTFFPPLPLCTRPAPSPF